MAFSEYDAVAMLAQQISAPDSGEANGSHHEELVSEIVLFLKEQRTLADSER